MVEVDKQMWNEKAHEQYTKYIKQNMIFLSVVDLATHLPFMQDMCKIPDIKCVG